jgi:protein-S-isoprenylcysteine O-methyltransferase Ste14
MTIFGAGHKIAMLVLPVLGVAIWLGLRYPEVFRFGNISQPVLLGSGIGLIVIGLAVNIFSARLMLRAFKQRQLLTTGPYAISRNPMYTSFIVLTIPGLGLALNCWAVLTVSVVMYIAIVLSVKEEEEWLTQTFGEQYVTYARNVGRIFPKVW